MSAAMVSAARPAAAGDAPSILDRIMRPGVELAIWERPRPAALAGLDGLDWRHIDDLDFPVAVATLDAELADGLAEAGYSRDGRGLALRDELAALLRRFAGVLGCAAVRFRLEVVETDACRKFHSDLVTARLLTTLTGPGTQWIDAAAPDRIHQLGPGDVAIFKGRRWTPEPAILHRSPPIAGTGDTRLLLAIDPVETSV